MAKGARRKVSRRAKKSTKRRKRAVAKRARASSARRTSSRRATTRRVVRKAARKRVRRKAVRTHVARKAARKHVAKKAVRKHVARASTPRPTAARPAGVARLDRSRRVLLDDDAVQTPPSSLDMDRHGSAARSGRKGLEANIRRHNDMSPAITGGDVDADWENAYFSGDEAPGGDNLTPDQEDVDDMGKALGVEYQDNEELQGSDKVVKRDAHRWELDPASSDDYKDRT
jgi:hypothetical protein